MREVVKQTMKYFQLIFVLFAYGLSIVLMVLGNIFFSFNQKYLKAHRNSKTTRKNTIVEYLDYQARKNDIVEYLDYQINEERYSRVP